MSFVATSGQAIGVLGKNGSGKSTLLRILAGNESPTTGEVLAIEKPTMLGVSAALQPHLTGRENVRIGLLSMGLPLKEVKALEEAVCSWAQIGVAIERPMKTYSSGMKARLKFSISTAVKRKVLLVDEALSTGDATFNARAQERMKSFLEASGTILMVSHSASTILNHCNRAIWLHDGELIADGSVEKTVKLYRSWSRLENDGQPDRADRLLEETKSRFIPTEILFDREVSRLLA